MKRIFTTILFVSTTVVCFAAVGIWRVGVTINGNTTTQITSNGSLNLGTVPANSVILNGISASSFQNSGDDVCSVTARYNLGGTPVTAPLSFVSQTGGDKNWAISGQSLNISTLAPGSYTIPISFDIFGRFGNVTCFGSTNGFNFNNAGSFTISFTIAAPLPVALTRFQARKSDGEVVLVWNTASETNNSHFKVERSANGSNWATITQISGAGESTTNREYVFVDKKPVTGKNYYRLQQVDFNGRTEQSNVVSVHFGTKATIYPNPVLERLWIETDATTRLILMDAAGRQVQNQEITESGWIKLQALPQGMYHAIIVDESGNSVLNEKLVKL